MAIKEKFTAWFIRNILKSRIEELDKPGFVTTEVGDGIKVREIFLQERVLANIEDHLIQKRGDEGRKALYSAGKLFGWRYAEVSGLPQANEDSRKEIKRFSDFFLKYMEYIYSSGIEYSLDLDEKEFRMTSQEYSVCRKNGKGYLLMSGAIAGVVSYIFSDDDLEAVKTKCQGRGDEKCEIICAMPENLPEEPFKSDVKHIDHNSSKYSKVNRVREAENSDSSIKSLLDKDIFKYKSGVLSYQGERYVPVGSSLVDILEQEVEKLGEEGILFDVAYEEGKLVGKEKELSFVTDYLAALGWGDIKPLKEGRKVHVHYYPWTEITQKTNLELFRGLLSGALEGVTGSQIRFDDHEEKLSSKGFNLIMEDGGT